MCPGWLRAWFLRCAAAECIGMCAATAAHFGTVLALFGVTEAMAAGLGIWLLLALAAVPEGLVLGGTRRWRLGRPSPDLPPGAWFP